MEDFNKKLKTMKLLRYAFDIVSFIIYFIVANILKPLYSLTTVIFAMIFLIVIGVFVRNQFVVKPFNNVLEYYQVVKKNDLKL